MTSGARICRFRDFSAQAGDCRPGRSEPNSLDEGSRFGFCRLLRTLGAGRNRTAAAIRKPREGIFPRNGVAGHESVPQPNVLEADEWMREQGEDVVASLLECKRFSHGPFDHSRMKTPLRRGGKHYTGIRRDFRGCPRVVSFFGFLRSFGCFRSIGGVEGFEVISVISMNRGRSSIYRMIVEK